MRRSSPSGMRMAVPALLLVAFAAQCLGSMRLKSPTFDEPTYLAAGYVGVTRGLELNPIAPPLVKYAIAVPLLLVGSSPADAIPHWGNAVAERRSYSMSFLFENRVDADTLLFAGRAAVLGASLLLAALVWTWAFRLYGFGGAVVALGLYAFCPNLIAHSTLATLDLGVTAGVALASYAVWRAYARPTWWSGARAGAAIGVALLTKSTAALILPVMPVQLWAAVLHHRRSDERRRRAAALPRAARRGEAAVPASSGAAGALLGASAIALAVAVGAIAVAYTPSRGGLSGYLAGFDLGVFHREAFMDRNYRAFCLGRYSADGFWWYFLAAFLVKTPLVTLVATAATVVWLVRRGRTGIFDELFLVLPIVAFFLATLFVRDALGVRYILPVYPLLFVLIGGMAVDAWRSACARLRARSRSPAVAGVLAASLALAYVGGTLAVFPDYLAFFNGVVCTPADGIRCLDDSNVDWGQDFKQLGRYLRAHGIERVRGLYYPFHFIPYVTRYYGVALDVMSLDEVGRPLPGWYAVSAHLLQRPALNDTTASAAIRFDWLDRFTPVARIGDSIYLYHFE